MSRPKISVNFNILKKVNFTFIYKGKIKWLNEFLCPQSGTSEVRHIHVHACIDKPISHMSEQHFTSMLQRNLMKEKRTLA